MPVACFNQFFWPDTAATGQLLADVVEALAHEDRGSERPLVICSEAQYGDRDDAPEPSARILRTKPLPFQRGHARRAASYASYMLASWRRAFQLGESDVVLTMTTPPLLSLTGNLMRLLHGSRHVIWEMDVYPDVAVDLGVFSANSLVTRLLAAVSNWSRNRADAIIALGEEMKDRLVAQGIPANKIHVCENWADGAQIQPVPFPDGPLHLHYSGNLGLAHDIATVRDVIRDLKDDTRFRFTFAGAGPRRKEFEQFCAANSLASVRFQPYASRAGLSESLGEGHIGLVTQKPETLGSVVPSKTYGIMAAGRPILFIGPRQATPARIIDRFDCGWRVDPGDGAGLRALLETLAANPDLIYRAGARARTAFEQHYDRAIGVARILDVIEARPIAAAVRKDVPIASSSKS
ncbi:MAG: glycosyltransferase family 4 protein [Bryobacteraceae bacterium]